MAIDPDWYQHIWEALDSLHAKRYSGETMEHLDATSIVPFAEEVKKHLEEFVVEIIARTKAQDEAFQAKIKYHRTTFESKGYEDATPHAAPIRP